MFLKVLNSHSYQMLSSIGLFNSQYISNPLVWLGGDILVRRTKTKFIYLGVGLSWN
jgi:hypothetical protein